MCTTHTSYICHSRVGQESDIGNPVFWRFKGEETLKILKAVFQG